MLAGMKYEGGGGARVADWGGCERRGRAPRRTWTPSRRRSKTRDTGGRCPGQDPMASVRLPGASQGKLAIPTAEEIDALADTADERMRMAVLLGSRCGLRRNEMLGLTSDRVAWMRDWSVRVDRQSARQSMAEPMSFTTLKSSHSNRTIPLPEDLALELSELVRIEGLGEFDLLVHDHGRGFVPQRFNGLWRSLRAKVGSTIRYHGLRHFYCSTLLAAGVNVKAVATAAGHSSPVITLSTYSHVMRGDEDRIRRAVSERGPSNVALEDRGVV
jgi:integrase